MSLAKPMDKDRISHCLALSRLARGQQGEALAATLAGLEAALREMQPAPGAELLLDHAGYVTAWNEGAEQLFGYRASEALGQHVLFLYADDDADGDIAEMAADAGRAVADVRRRKKSGEVIRVRLDIALVRDAAGQPTGMRVQVAPASRVSSTRVYMTITPAPVFVKQAPRWTLRSLPNWPVESTCAGHQVAPPFAVKKIVSTRSPKNSSDVVSATTIARSTSAALAARMAWI